MDELEKVTHARDEAEARLMRIPGVTAVGVGHKVVGGVKTDTIAIVVFVRGKRDDPEEAIPPEIEGVPTDVQERAFVLHDMDAHEREREGADGGRAGRGSEGQRGEAG